MMAAAAKYRDDVSGTVLVATNTPTAYQVITNQSLSPSLTNGFRLSFLISSGLTNTGPVTLAVDGLPAKQLRVTSGVAAAAGMFVAGRVYDAVYYSSGDEWLVPDYVDSNPTGAILPYGGASAPSGYLLCDGTAVSRTTFAALFAVIGTFYGVGNGSTTFNVPDLRGRVPGGLDGGTGRLDTFASLGAAIGLKTHTLTTAEIPSHTHNNTLTDPGHAHTEEGVENIAGVQNGSAFSAFVVPAASNGTSSNTTGITINNAPAGGGAAHNNVQPTLAVNYLIKT
jgi:microcystin-dependent protein